MPTATEKAGKILLRVRPRGFCAGVVRAVDIVELALEAYGAPVYVHHEIVHNTYVVEQLRRRGAIFVEAISDVPNGNVLVFSAHGVPPTVRQEAKDRSLKVIDATCPLVTKVHLEALKFAREKRTIILIGHKDHQEIVGTSGEAPDRTIVVDSVDAVDALEVARDALLIDLALALDRRLELRGQPGLIRIELGLRVLELLQVADRRLIDDADVGDVGREHLRRQRERQRGDRSDRDGRVTEPAD